MNEFLKRHADTRIRQVRQASRQTQNQTKPQTQYFNNSKPRSQGYSCKF